MSMNLKSGQESGRRDHALDRPGASLTKRASGGRAARAGVWWCCVTAVARYGGSRLRANSHARTNLTVLQLAPESSTAPGSPGRTRDATAMHGSGWPGSDQYRQRQRADHAHRADGTCLTRSTGLSGRRRTVLDAARFGDALAAAACKAGVVGRKTAAIGLAARFFQLRANGLARGASGRAAAAGADRARNQSRRHRCR